MISFICKFDALSFVCCQNELDINRGALLTAFAAQTSCSYEDARAIRDANEGLKLLSFAFDTRLDLHHCKF